MLYRKRPSLSFKRNQIRLIRYVPDAAHEDHYYTVDVYNLDLAPSYLAVSYTWGEPLPTRTLKVGQEDMEVAENCYYALSQLRQHYQTALLWIDTICIDQDNLEEKNHQVQIMGQIFSKAHLVIACVGAGGEDCQHLELLRDGKACECHTHGVNPASMFRYRAYWTRLWVVQELYLAREVIVLCGDTGFSRDVLSRIMPPASRANTRQRSTFAAAFAKKNVGPMDLFNAISLFAHAECRDPHDRIYGLWSITQQAVDESITPVKVDYSLDLTTLALQVLSLYRQNGLQFLVAATQMLKVLGIRRDSASISKLFQKRQSDLLEAALHPSDARYATGRSGWVANRSR